MKRAQSRGDRAKRRPARDFGSLLGGPVEPSETCAICLADFEHGEQLVVMPCDGSHTFHPKCLRHWLTRSTTCPCCREDARPEPVALDPTIAREVLRARQLRGADPAPGRRNSQPPSSR